MSYEDTEARKAYLKEYRRKWMAERRRAWFADKLCEKCGSNNKLQIHHIDPSTKVDHKIWSWSKKRRDVELAKCQVLCYYCHLEETNEYHKQGENHREHGTFNMYSKIGCRCTECRRANADHRNKYRNHCSHSLMEEQQPTKL